MTEEKRRPAAIETVYDGYRFRSRLEARWAVFFDTADIEWRYEHEGFELESGEWYLPDFYLPNVGCRSTEDSPLWIEIKPTKEHADFETAKSFVETTGEPLAVLAGPVENTGQYELAPLNGQVAWDNFMQFMKCEDCGLVKYEFDEGNYRSCESCGGSCTERHPIFEEATVAARSARFEHGESPNASAGGNQ